MILLPPNFFPVHYFIHIDLHRLIVMGNASVFEELHQKLPNVFAHNLMTFAFGNRP